MFYQFVGAKFSSVTLKALCFPLLQWQTNKHTLSQNNVRSLSVLSVYSQVLLRFWKLELEF